MTDLRTELQDAQSCAARDKEWQEKIKELSMDCCGQNHVWVDLLLKGMGLEAMK